MYVLRSKRTVRTTSEADSSKLGELQVGALLCIVERAELPDGTKRVRVARYNKLKPLGWITNLGRRESVEALSPFHWMRFQRNPQQQQRAKSASGRMGGGGAADQGHKEKPESGAVPDIAIILETGDYKPNVYRNIFANRHGKHSPSLSSMLPQTKKAFTYEYSTSVYEYSTRTDSMKPRTSVPGPASQQRKGQRHFTMS